MAAACIACGLIAAGCIACALVGDRISGAITRARWAWACRKPPARTEGQLSRAEHLTFTGIAETWRQPDAPERSRT